MATDAAGEVGLMDCRQEVFESYAGAEPCGRCGRSGDNEGCARWNVVLTVGPMQLLCTQCMETVTRGDSVHAQAMRWLRLGAGCCAMQGAGIVPGIRFWCIGNAGTLTLERGKWWFDSSVGDAPDIVDRRTARALLVAAEVYAEGGGDECQSGGYDYAESAGDGE